MPTAQPRLKTLVIQIDDETEAKIADIAKADNKPVGQVAAEILTGSVCRTDFVGLRQEIAQLRRDFATATQAILATSGNISPKEAEDWVRRQLREY